jgi:hypothetical protein
VIRAYLGDLRLPTPDCGARSRPVMPTDAGNVGKNHDRFNTRVTPAITVDARSHPTPTSE